jgi:hypothetical protein
MGKHGLQNRPQQISWVYLKSNKRFTHTHTRPNVHNTANTHTQPKLLTPPQGTHPICQLRKNPQNNPFQPLEVAGNRLWKSPKILFNRRTTTRRKIGASARRKKIGAFPRPTHLSQISFSPILLLPSSLNPN